MSNYDEHVQVSKGIVWYSFLIFGVIAVLTLLSLMLKPAWLGFEREAMQQSHQYVDSKKHETLTFVEKYKELEVDILKYEAGEGNEKIVTGMRGQQRALLKRVRHAVQMLPSPSEIPPSVKEFLAEHKDDK